MAVVVAGALWARAGVAARTREIKTGRVVGAFRGVEEGN
jgi:hypothetical protein